MAQYVRIQQLLCGTALLWVLPPLSFALGARLILPSRASRQGNYVGLVLTGQERPAGIPAPALDQASQRQDPLASLLAPAHPGALQTFRRERLAGRFHDPAADRQIGIQEFLVSCQRLPLREVLNLDCDRFPLCSTAVVSTVS